MQKYGQRIGLVLIGEHIKSTETYISFYISCSKVYNAINRSKDIIKNKNIKKNTPKIIFIKWNVSNIIN